MSCSSCSQNNNPCGCTKKKESCDNCPIVDWVPNTACTLGVTMNGCTDTLELRPGIQNCETKTHFGQNPITGCLEYQNELYAGSDGVDGYIESVCPADIAKFINLEDLANVEDVAPENCALLTYKTKSNCGAGCTGTSDTWEHWYAKDHLSTGLHYVAGFNGNGCLEALDIPPRTNEYWWGMWRPNDTGTGLEFGYIQPENVGNLPKNSDGTYTVLSQTSNGKPIVGKIATSFSLCDRAKEFICRGSDPTSLVYWFVPNSTRSVEFNVTPDNDPDWRAPCCGLMYVSYCVNPVEQNAIKAEIDVTIMKSNETWSEALEGRWSTHSTWTFSQANSDTSETCSAMRLLNTGETIKLHARDDDTGHMHEQSVGRWRVHAVKAVFIPLEKN